MAIKVLVVDDSSFFRRRVSEIINSEARLEVIDVATNGKEAVEKALTIKPDVITMDIEMPVMDGITAVREIMAKSPVPILMFSSLTHDGAKATLDALEAGALDFLPKKFEDIARNRDEAVTLLQQRVIQIASKRASMRRAISRPAPTQTTPQTAGRTPTRPTPAPAARPSVATRFKATGKKYQLTAIGTSTGGPVALQKILTKLPANYPHPIVLIQHMPATFTAAFASRLNSLCKIQVKEAEDGDVLKPGVAYLAPGGKQMMIDGRPGSAKLRIIDGGERMNYKPCVDVTFGSAAKIYSNQVLSMVLTGMGADGREGARMLKGAGATIWAQDEDSCVVYGMPQAVAKAGLSTEDLPLDRIAERMLVEVGLA
ncbi:chemotaxis response regulator protein-glutamate methylesterase [Vibrio brasiliensis]|jgi:two-component system chemotaxis response regulator CheB|uniref:Protein-glutamate methylesterase/protein-glutamine glutaminase n=1 Tax=Vibrio brasiliensis LMG 20546 TaxID=945543 RepID=E8LUR2_9VIBR|nr:chemotaxis response regulator protein-glutamate methylesterase [Vibrio brasiliensis]EGA65558.1 chemotaxis-specific methylesterase [Vibrio brasiliensis LMG 20546]MCG9649463.1 chemotaxis response regulator protein-glutamate methylesterase [Vibrio brasiliensis]MCG9724299.1 chemotaxis response regulator protein-glutamate methylesterase [Vibrio brasiliensis]MCG9751392.1 chemotaxis response regulator protein-glutamate methylesterase [Vibrio brasiliensis]MCG9782059.1 chemotaxis response regulator 